MIKLRPWLTALVVVVVLPTSAIAQEGSEDLAGLFEAASDADFYAEGIVMTHWDGASAAASYDVTRTAGMSMAHSRGGAFMTGDGVTASLSGTDWYALEVAEWSAWTMSDRYSVTAPVPTERLGRPATQVDVMEGDLLRARLVLDDESTVPLLVEVYDADGSPYRVAATVAFSDQPTMSSEDMPEEFAGREMMDPAEAPDALPAEVHGYARADTYGVGESSVQSFYTDGMFSFSVFAATRGSMAPEFQQGTIVAVGEGAPYRRLVTAGQVWVQWDTGGSSYVLVGDLPPDHLDEVLAGLPRPGPRGVVTRWLGRLFG